MGAIFFSSLPLNDARRSNLRDQDGKTRDGYFRGNRGKKYTCSNRRIKVRPCRPHNPKAILVVPLSSYVFIKARFEYIMQFTDTLVEAYERHAQERASNFPDGFKKQEQLEFLKFLNKEQRKTILEIGCGAGWDAQFFQDQGFRIFAIDNAPTMVKLTNDRGIPAQVLGLLTKLDQNYTISLE